MTYICLLYITVETKIKVNDAIIFVSEFIVFQLFI